jgi:hypothetical protein
MPVGIFQYNQYKTNVSRGIPVLKEGWKEGI